jgi:hypothetical protein
MTPREGGGYLYETWAAPYLPHPTVEDLALDPNGRAIWIATERGLASFRPFDEATGGGGGEIGAYPNPFVTGCSDGVRLLGAGGHVRGYIVDLSGRVVARFPGGGGAGDLLEPGEPVWDGTRDGARVAPGMYVIQVETPRGLRSVGLAVMDGGCGSPLGRR